MRRLDDGTEDFDERCTCTESCECEDCLAECFDTGGDCHCRVCGAPFEDDEPGVWNGVQWAHERCDEQPTPPEPSCPATLDLFDAEH
jgi:hypothetical protein